MGVQEIGPASNRDLWAQALVRHLNGGGGGEGDIAVSTPRQAILSLQARWTMG